MLPAPRGTRELARGRQSCAFMQKGTPAEIFENFVLLMTLTGLYILFTVY